MQHKAPRCIGGRRVLRGSSRSPRSGSKSGLLDALIAGLLSRDRGETTVNSLSKVGQFGTFPAVGPLG
jgi:hypothetical protein